jgi:hypothetical protein
MNKGNRITTSSSPGLKTQGTSCRLSLKKEIFEECGINIKKFKLISTKSFKYIRDGKQVLNDSYVYEIQEYTGTIINKEPQKHAYKSLCQSRRF